MAIPPRRWVGYALVVAGLSLLFDTYTFLRTNWSPLRIPMYAENELAIGYLLSVVGAVLVLAPTLIRMLDRYAPYESVNRGGWLAHQSVERQLQGRLSFSAKSLLAKKTVSWLVVALGLLVGFLGLSISGCEWLPSRATDPYWYKPLIGIAGVLFLGLTLVIASLAATRDRRRAGLILLIGTPTIAFCLSYPNAGFLAWEKRGGIFYSPFLWIAFGLSLLFFAPFVVSLRALPNKKRAMYLFLITAAIVTPVFVRSQWSARCSLDLLGGQHQLPCSGSFGLELEP